MKKILFLLVLTVVAFSCKEKENNDPEYKGEFIYIADAAVLKGTDFIYGVTIDAMAEKLADKVSKIKRDDFDMVPVVVKGKLSKNPLVEQGGEGWEQVLTITEIVEVSTTPSEADIKIEEKK
jgi:hypothetical protein